MIFISIKFRLRFAVMLALVLLGVDRLFPETADDFGEVFPDDAARVSFDLAAWCEVGGHRFRFEHTPLAEIIRDLGGGRLDRTGDAGAANFDYFVNYTDGRHLITFSSNNDMGGDDHALQGVAIRNLTGSEHPEQWPRLKLPIKFPFGSSDLSFTKLTQKLGPTSKHHGVCAYTYFTKYKAHDDRGSWVIDAYAYLELRVREGAIIALSVDHTSESEGPTQP